MTDETTKSHVKVTAARRMKPKSGKGKDYMLVIGSGGDDDAYFVRYDHKDLWPIFSDGAEVDIEFTTTVYNEKEYRNIVAGRKVGMTVSDKDTLIVRQSQMERAVDVVKTAIGFDIITKPETLQSFIDQVFNVHDMLVGQILHGDEEEDVPFEEKDEFPFE